MGKNKWAIKQKAPQLIVLAIAIALIAYVLFEILEDVVVNGSGPLIGSLISFTTNVKDSVSSWGYGGIFGLMLLESSSLPIPSEAILPFAGFLVGKGQLDFTITVIVATSAALIGSSIDYYIGLKGTEVLVKHRILGKTLLNMNQLELVGKWFRKHGSVMVFIARLIPGLRTLISFPAGAANMSIAKFLAFTAAGCVVWNILLIYVGYYLGVNWTEVAGVSHYIIIVVVAVLVAMVVLYLIMRQKINKAQKLTN